MGKIKKLFTPVKLDDGDYIPDHRVNKRVDGNLNTLAAYFNESMGPHFESMEKDMLRRTIFCKDMKNIDSFVLDYYRYENRLWTINYNLRVRSWHDVSEDPVHQEGAIVFHCKSKGRTKTKNAHWTAVRTDCSEEMAELYMKKLNHKLIMDRIDVLDVSDLWLRYDPEEQDWGIEYFTIIGSSNWMLIPPLNQLIKPTNEECARMVELIQLCFSAVTSKQVKEQLKKEAKEQ